MPKDTVLQLLQHPIAQEHNNINEKEQTYDVDTIDSSLMDGRNNQIEHRSISEVYYVKSIACKPSADHVTSKRHAPWKSKLIQLASVACL